jgi:hypothetical protein
MRSGFESQRDGLALLDSGGIYFLTKAGQLAGAIPFSNMQPALIELLYRRSE